MISIAIDGPSGAGKSTIARIAATKLGYIYVDTGALYRAIGLAVHRAKIDCLDEQALAQLLSVTQLSLVYREGVQRVLLNGEDVSEEIRLPEMSMAASQVSAIAAVREFLFDLQQNMARENNVVMDGRDIGTVVLPCANVKIFLTASPEDRASRRLDELLSKGMKAEYEQVLAEMIQRDYQDANREVAPLCQAPDAILLDTTGNELEQSVELVLKTIKDCGIE
ncbi:(d)CMP kinase [Oscillospiraceae bacterium MB08-C2-2]|nr:(d)CMP kinase [Oscillospiraceae bacterium MB08-C2-2]